ncbi:MAG: radical SAM protein [Candidatus Aenigmarchaeota archaeon]|nr:radical SAM protein [Candidatus Aenigmarchaeota archaeon]
MDEKIRRLLRWAKGEKNYPLSIELSPTLRCNLDCLFCWRQEKNNINSEELSFEKYKEILKEASEIHVKEVRVIGGGEPLLRKDTFAIMKEIKSKGMFGYICTNGTLFNERMIKELVRIGFDHVKISLHGSNAEIHDSLVNVKGSFGKSLKNIILFNEWKKKLKKEKPLIEIGTVLVRENYKDIVNIVNLAHSLNVHYFFVEPITVYSEIGKKMKLRKKDLKEFEKIAIEGKEITDKYGIKNNLSDFIGSELVEKTGRMKEMLKRDIENERAKFPSLPCYEPWLRMGIRVDGRVCPCGFFDEESNENVREKSLEEIWFGEYFNLRRRQILDGKLPEHCKKCCVTLVVENKLIRNELEKFRFMI